jgi:hypothetical protein
MIKKQHNRYKIIFLQDKLPLPPPLLPLEAIKHLSLTLNHPIYYLTLQPHFQKYEKCAKIIADHKKLNKIFL